MARIKKLTPQIIKRIIAEEKQKLRLERRKANKVRRQKRSKLKENNDLRDIKLLKLISREEVKAAIKFKKLFEAKQKLKKKIIRDL